MGMVIGHLIGAIMITPLIAYYYLDSPKNSFKKNLKTTLGVYGLTEIEVKKVKKKDYGWHVQILLPHGMTVEDFIKEISGIEQSMVAKIKFKHVAGRLCSLDFGTHSLNRLIEYEDVPKDGMKIPLATPFGYIYLDLFDGSSCHLIGGGATRMGKTVFLLLIAVHLCISSKAKARLYISSAKIADYYMFRDVENVTLAEPQETLTYLEEAVQEYERRKQIITELGDCNDAVTLAQKHPDKKFQPIFFIIDEVAVFAKASKSNKEYNEQVQEKITEIAERAGYVDVHLIIFSQRPDARDVLDPRIKTNMLTKIAFTTSNKRDSEIILGIEGAEKLGGIKGRAIYIDSLPEEVQVPYISNDVADKLLKPYKKKKDDKNDEKRQIDNQATPSLPSFISGSVRDIDLSRGS
jgi:hypothetical protein